MKEYKQNYVAFLDIMGFKSLLSESSCDEVYSIFEILHKKSRTSLNFNFVQIKAYDHIYHTILSDSIVLYIESDIDDAFAALLDVCYRLQLSLANRDKPILLRGGISIGELFYENDIIYGEGLTKAYLLESNLAKYPRIIFSGDILKLGISNAKHMYRFLKCVIPIYKLDDDSFYILDYLLADYLNTNDKIKYFDRLQETCDYYLNKEINYSLREKYIWLQKNIKRAIKICSNVDDYYKKLEKEQVE